MIKILFLNKSQRQIIISSVAQLCLTLCDPMDCSTPGLPVHHQFLEFAQTHVHRIGDAIQPSHPLSSPSPPAFNLSQHQGLSQWVSSSHQFSSVAQSCPTLFDPMDGSTPGFPVHHQLPELAQTHVHRVGVGVSGVSASASTFPINIQEWFPLGLIGLISLQSKGLSRVLRLFRTQIIMCYDKSKPIKPIYHPKFFFFTHLFRKQNWATWQSLFCAEGRGSVNSGHLCGLRSHTAWAQTSASRHRSWVSLHEPCSLFAPQFPGAQRVKRLPAMRETRVRSLRWEDPLEKEMVTHSSILAWTIPWTEKPGGLRSMGSQRVRHDWATSLSLFLLETVDHNSISLTGLGW